MIPQAVYYLDYGHLESLFNQPRNYIGASITTEVAIHCHAGIDPAATLCGWPN